MRRTKSYAERLFDFPHVGPLSPDSARIALERPAAHLGVAFADAAIQEVYSRTQGYPYFLQEWGKHVWDVAPTSPITAADVDKASEVAVSALDASFFGVRFDRLTPSEKRYLRAMAELGAGHIAPAISRRCSDEA